MAVLGSYHNFPKNGYECRDASGRIICKLRGERYRNPGNEWLAKFIQEKLFTFDYEETAAWYAETARKLSPSTGDLALLGCNDRYFLLTVLLGRQDAGHPWLFDRCREVERDPDGYIDLWARFHYKSTIITFAGAVREVLCNPEITIAIFSVVKPIAQAFLAQIKGEFETNELLKGVYPDVLYRNPRTLGPDGRPGQWSLERGITVKRKGNPKEATIEAHGLIDGQPTSRHFQLHIYDDVVTQDHLSEEGIRKTTERWELADNLGSHLGVRKWMPGIRRIFEEFAKGRSPRAIAGALNKEAIPGPAGKMWGASTIYGNWRRGTGILNNELYIGRLVWNRQQFMKDPNTGRRQARLNPETKWIVERVPHLRILDDHWWNLVKEHQRENRSRVMTKDKGIRCERARRPRYLLSGLLRCGTCGGGFSKISQTHYGCSTARNKGTCDNLLTLRRDELEAKVLDGLRHHLMHPEMVRTFIDEFHREVNRQASEQDVHRERATRDLEKTKREIRRLIAALKAGVPGAAVKDEITTLEARRRDLLGQLEAAPPTIVRLHPNIAEVYRRKIVSLGEALNDEHTRTEAAECVRALIEEIRLVPEKGKLRVELYGELAALINLANEHPRSGGTGAQVTLVAGARNLLYRTRTEWRRRIKRPLLQPVV